VDRPALTAYGEHALLLQLAGDDQRAVEAWAEAVRAAGLAGVLDVVPAARSVLLHLATGTTPQQAAALVAGLAAPSADGGEPPPSVATGPADVVELPVVYDGPDLEAVAQATGLTPDEVVAAHTGTLWRCGFAGFAPGFGYLRSPDDRLTVPRRPEPRTGVPAGSVALAAGYSAVYPRRSPGGWQLIGRTTTRLWDLERDPPALVRPGTSVRFVQGSA
jgi:KipI family sensor histidine kinase inhibitor